MVQLVPLCFQVLTERLLEWWSHFGHRPDITARIYPKKRSKEQRGKKREWEYESTYPLSTSTWNSAVKIETLSNYSVKEPQRVVHEDFAFPASFVKGPVIHMGPCLEASISSKVMLWAGADSRSEANNSSTLLLYYLALYRSLCQLPQWGSESTWCHHLYHHCCLLGGNLSGCAHVHIRQWGSAHQGANHVEFNKFVSYRDYDDVVYQLVCRFTHSLIRT